jgi:Tol biopolymer transport system component
VAGVLGANLATWTDKQIAISGSGPVAQFRSPPELAAISPAWSPDATQLAFAAMPEAPDVGLGAAALQLLMARHIWVATPAQGRVTRLTTDARYRDEHPQWSAQGMHILFARLAQEGQASLWLMSSAGGDPALVVDELTPAPDPIGDYGLVDWAQHYDWWRE